MLHIGREKLERLDHKEGDEISQFDQEFNNEYYMNNPQIDDNPTQQDFIQNPSQQDIIDNPIIEQRQNNHNDDEKNSFNDDKEKKQQEREIISFESLNRLDNERQHFWKKFNFKMKTGWFLRLFLVDLLRLLMNSRRAILKNKDLHLEDIPHLFPKDQTSNVNKVFEQLLNEQQNNVQKQGKDLGAYNMLVIFLKAFKSQLSLIFVQLFFTVTFKLVSSVCIRNLINDIAAKEEKNVIYMWAAIVAISNFLHILLIHISNRLCYCLFSQIRVMFMKSLFMKISNLSAFAIKEANVGKLVNLVSGDLTSVEIKNYFIVNLSVIPLGLIAVAVILYFRNKSRMDVYSFILRLQFYSPLFFLNLVFRIYYENFQQQYFHVNKSFIINLEQFQKTYLHLIPQLKMRNFNQKKTQRKNNIIIILNLFIFLLYFVNKSNKNEKIIKFGWCGVVGLLLMICFLPIQLYIANKSSKVFAEKSGLVDKRVNLTNEIIEGIRLIKMYAWEGAFMKAILEIRNLELKKIFTILLLFITEHALSISSCFLGCYFIFALTHKYGDSSYLTIANMFSTLDLLQYTKASMIGFSGYGLAGALELKVVLQRMASVFKIQQTQMTCIEGKNDYENTVLEKGEIRMKKFSAFWKGEQPVLKDLTLDIKQGECISIVGKIGSGKSTLLNCILKEVPKYKGGFCFKGRIAYVEQEPYIFSSSVRDNIIFGKKYKEPFYNEVVKACNLLDDFKILDNGDLTQIGERGINISGGQKARISLARAVYSQADIYLFDDPLSAVDTKVASSLFNGLIKTFLKNSTILLVTHQIHFTRWTDRIIIMNEGQIIDQGTFSELEDQLKELANQMHLHDESSKNSSFAQKQKVEIDENTKKNQIISDVQQKQINNENNLQQQDQNNDEKEIQEQIEENDKKYEESEKQEEEKKKKKIVELYTKEQNENQDVNITTYLKYIKASKMAFLIPILIILFFGSEGLNIYYTIKIGDFDNNSGEKVINALGYITLGFAVNLFVKYFLLIKLQNKGSQGLHNQMMNALIRSKVLYFDTTESGRIINRFSTDLVIVDQGLPVTSIDAIEIICSQISLLIMIVTINPYFLIVAFFLYIILFKFFMMSKICIIQSKYADLRNRSPVFNYFASTIQGVLPIRVYGQTKLFQYKFDELSDNSLRSSFIYWLNVRGFGSYVQICSSIASIIGIFMIISVDKSGSDVGQSIVYLLTMSDSIQWGLRQIIATDATMSSTKRILNMCEIPPEPELITEYDENIVKKSLVTNQDTDQGQVVITQEKQVFPAQGKVEFQNVRMRYREGLDPVLNNLTFTIEPGMRVGCIGRTGAGKSSILQALFRMTEIDEPENQNEEIAIKIDGHNTRKLGLHTLRGGISMIPQIPFIFSGTILRNLDPLNEYTKQQVMDVISDIGLTEKINSLEKGILTDMTNASEVFSVGQKQLICLGRAILKKSKLLILDEATANVDMNTDELIQNKIKERFTDSTVITVAHRLNTIADYDMIIVMDKGAVLETGTPYLLLQNDKSAFKAMVDHTGKKNTQAILDIAKNAYENKQKIS